MRSKRLFFLPFFSLNVIQNACWSSCYIFRPWYSRQISGEWLRRQVFNILSLWKWTFLISALLVWKEEEINRSVTTLIMDWSNIWGGLVYLSRSLSHSLLQYFKHEELMCVIRLKCHPVLSQAVEMLSMALSSESSWSYDPVLLAWLKASVTCSLNYMPLFIKQLKTQLAGWIVMQWGCVSVRTDSA